MTLIPARKLAWSSKLLDAPAAKDEHNDDVEIDTIAAEHGISVRYGRQLFADEERTYSDFVTDQRLTRAQAMLTSPRFADASIATLAFEVGFGDLSHFNRMFRRRYQATPSEIRREALDAWREAGRPALAG